MQTNRAPTTRDYFAEMYVAGVLADKGWNVYFPRRDQGFDFIVTKHVDAQLVVRPVQVKGKYPTAGKVNCRLYGYTGRLTQVHPEMVLAIPFFATETQAAPMFTSYLPFAQLRRAAVAADGYRVFPAKFEGGRPRARSHYARFVDDCGIALMGTSSWATEVAGDDGAGEDVEGEDIDAIAG